MLDAELGDKAASKWLLAQDVDVGKLDVGPVFPALPGVEFLMRCRADGADGAVLEDSDGAVLRRILKLNERGSA